MNTKRLRGGYKHGHLPSTYPNTKNGFTLEWINKKPLANTKTKNGYIEIDIRKDFDFMSNNPNKVKRGRYLEHHYVMEKKLGRYLKPTESVHHKNLLRNDNRLQNLELWCGTHPSGARVEDLIDYIIEMYSEEVLIKIKNKLEQNRN